jgi:membrane protein
MADAAKSPLKRDACPLPAPELHHGPRVIVDWAKLIWCGMNESRSLGLAAQMAFWLFFSLIPLAAVGGLVLARIVGARGDLAATMLGSTPPAVRDLMTSQLGQVAKWNGGAVAPLAAIVFAWLASSGIHAVFDALEAQSGVGRPWWKKRLIALGTCAGLSLGIAVLALLNTGLGWFFRLAGTNLPHALMAWEGSWLIAVVRVVFGALIAFGLIVGIYAAGTPRVHDHSAVVPGGLLAVSLQAASGFGYGLYVRLMGTGNAYQAGLGIIGVTLMSLYLFCLALLAGAELNQAVSDRRASQDGPLLGGQASHGCSGRFNALVARREGARPSAGTSSGQVA